MLIGILIGILTIALIIQVQRKNSMKDIEANANPLENIVSADMETSELVDVKLEYFSKQTYENIDTYIFTFNDANDNLVLFSNSNISFNELLGVINNWLEEIEDKVVAFGIAGKQLFIQVDTRYKVDTPQKLGIMTLKDNLSASEWIELLETISNDKEVYTNSLISHETYLGKTHYFYIYRDIVNNKVTKSPIIIDEDNIEIGSDAVTEEAENIDSEKNTEEIEG